MNRKFSAAIPTERLEQAIYFLRGEKVMLDEDLARLYQVKTKALVQAVKRNEDRFPEDFMFQLTTQEYTLLRSQIVTSSGRLAVAVKNELSTTAKETRYHRGNGPEASQMREYRRWRAPRCYKKTAGIIYNER